MGYVSTCMGDCLSVLLVSGMALQLALVDRNTFLHCFIKRPARDACLCMGELQAPAAPHFVFLVTLLPLGGFFSNLAGLGSSLGEFF